MLIISYGTYTPSRHKCRRCKKALTSTPEKIMNEWAIRCFECGSLNIIEYTIAILGYRTDEQWQENQEQ